MDNVTKVFSYGSICNGDIEKVLINSKPRYLVKCNTTDTEDMVKNIAIVMIQKNCDRNTAISLLEKYDGDVISAIMD